MGKITFTLIVASLIAITSYAQPSYTIKSLPSIGDSTTTINVDSTQAASLSPGSAGANQIWNYPVLTKKDSSRKSVVNPGSTPFASDYPTANICIRDTTNGYSYQNNQSNGTYYLGQEKGSTKTIYSNGAGVLFGLPLTYLTASSATEKGLTTAPFYTDHITTSDTILVDGYGTLKLPSGTFNNAIRFYSHLTQIDSIFVGSNFNSASKLRIVYYNWYDQNFKDVLFSISTLTLSGKDYKSATFIRKPIPAVITGVEQAEGKNNNVSVFPNPSDGNFTVKSNSAEKQLLQVFDITGKLILSQQILGSATIDASSFSKGVYNVSISNETVIENKMLVIVR